MADAAGDLVEDFFSFLPAFFSLAGDDFFSLAGDFFGLVTGEDGAGASSDADRRSGCSSKEKF